MKTASRVPMAVLCALIVTTQPSFGSPGGQIRPARSADTEKAPPREGEARPCRLHPQVNGPCFTVHGRMTYWNGTPSVRIWPVGTTRLLGVSEGRFKIPGYTNLPPDVASRVAWETDLFGDFVVCPFQDDQPGVMRPVCVDSGTSLVVRPRKPSD